MQNSDPDWPDVEALQSGDDSALDRIMERHRQPILGFVSRLVGNAGDAEELAQETFVRAYFHIHSYKPRAPFVAWLYQIARNLCRDYFRSRAYKQWLCSDSFDPQTREHCATTPEAPAASEQVEAVQAALLKVPLKLRECLVLTAIEGFSHAEAAARLGLSTKAVEVRSYRARKMLLKLLSVS